MNAEQDEFVDTYQYEPAQSVDRVGDDPKGKITRVILDVPIECREHAEKTIAFLQSILDDFDHDKPEAWERG